MSGRLFEGFQHRVEGLLGKHMHFVDDIYLETGTSGHVLGVVQHLAHIVDASIGSCIKLDQIDKTPAVDLRAGTAYTAGRGSYAGQTVQRFGKDTRNGGFSDTARTGEQVGMMQSILRERIAQGANDVLLSRELGESLGTPFPCKYSCGRQVTPRWK